MGNHVVMRRTPAGGARLAATLLLLCLLGATKAQLQIPGINIDISLPDIPDIDLPSLEDLAAQLTKLRDAVNSRVQQAIDNVDDGFNDFKQRFNLNITDPAEEALRKANFRQAAEFIQNNTNAAARYVLDLGPLAGLSLEEFTTQKLGLRAEDLPSVYNASFQNITTRKQRRLAQAGGSIPNSVNWVAQKRVAPVKDQGQCGCCWIFAATSVIETQSAIYTGELYALSEQQTLSCDSENHINGNGCLGGQLQWGFEYALANGGLTAQSGYPYTGSVSPCNTQAENWKVVQISGMEWVLSGNEQALMRAVSKGSVTVAVSAGSQAFQLYGGGIFDDPAACAGPLDHAVTVVGYDRAAGYWIIRNSWGRNWGENGYMRLAMGTPAGAPNGLCGILSYPLGASKSSPNKISGTPPAGAQLVNLAGNGTNGTDGGGGGNSGGNSAGAAQVSAYSLVFTALAALLLLAF